MSTAKKQFFSRLKLALVCTFSLSIMLFSMEPNGDFFVEHILESSYQDLEDFRAVAVGLQAGRLTEKELSDSIGRLDRIAGRVPVLAGDCRVLMADACRRLGDPARARELLLSVLKNGGENTARGDALLRLAEIYEAADNPSRAIALMLQYQDLFRHYKKESAYFTLARLYCQVEDLRASGRALLNVENLAESGDRAFFEKVVRANWDLYTQDEKRTVFRSLSRMKLADAYSALAREYIRKYSPPAGETEAIAFDIVSQDRGQSVMDFVRSLRENPGYASISQEMLDYCSLSRPDIQSHSGVIRGAYYNRLLRNLNRRARYDAKQAMDLYKTYIGGDTDREYTVKNLELAIRDLIAFKKYSGITNICEMTSLLPGFNSNTSQFSDCAAFWNGYARYMLSDYAGALSSFESVLNVCPDGYYSIQARLVMERLFESGAVTNNGAVVTKDGYVRVLAKRFASSDDLAQKLYCGRVLYHFQSGYARETTAEEVAQITRKVRPSDLFDYDNGVLARLRASGNYVKFVIYARFGFAEKAMDILSSAGIYDPQILDVLLLRELSRNRLFHLTEDLFAGLEQSDFIRENLAFLSPDLKKLLFPLPYESEISLALNKANCKDIDRYLVYSVIRGESLYIPTAHSGAGARGLMQVMPSTARDIAAGALGDRDVNLFNPLNNILIGTLFLKESIDNYGMISGIASYNGGISVISRTKKSFNPANELELMEILPYLETREYLKKIVRYYNIYSGLYRQRDVGAMFASLLKKNV